MQEPRLTYLFGRYLTKTCSADEKRELSILILNSKNDPKIMELLEQEWYGGQTDAELTEAQAQRILDSITGKTFISDTEQTVFQNTARIKPMFTWRRLLAAASVALLIGIASYVFLFNNKHTGQKTIAKTTILPNDIAAPKSSTAVITLTNGQQIVLDSAGVGTLGKQGNVNIVKLANGQIAYNPSTTAPQEVGYNTLSNPKGSKVISLTLVDGSKVWLNAESSLRFPTAFTGNNRNVQLTGEAYFEIAKNVDMPFTVDINEKTEILVTGTHFNINAYQNEENINTTLLEGSVKVFNGAATETLEPGQQAQVNNTKSRIKVVKNVNIDKVMAWKNGVFNFDDATLEEVMRQLERWYDIDVAYEKDIPQLEFVGKMGRDLTLAEVLRGLEVSKVHFRIEGRKLTVLP